MSCQRSAQKGTYQAPGHKQTSRRPVDYVGFATKSGHPRACLNISVQSITELMHRSKTASLFDHLAGECEQSIWHGQVEPFGGLEVGGELDGKIGRLSTLTLACGSIFQRGLRLAAPR